jgi:uncharacterized protein (UPF0128 family)
MSNANLFIVVQLEINPLLHASIQIGQKLKCKNKLMFTTVFSKSALKNLVARVLKLGDSLTNIRGFQNQRMDYQELPPMELNQLLLRW